LFNELRAEIEKLHSYEIPEAIAIPIVDGLEHYLEWMAGVLKTEQDS
jgi:periplasmic divalent cation tolerance protein